MIVQENDVRGKLLALTLRVPWIAEKLRALDHEKATWLSLECDLDETQELPIAANPLLQQEEDLRRAAFCQAFLDPPVM